MDSPTKVRVQKSQSESELLDIAAKAPSRSNFNVEDRKVLRKDNMNQNVVTMQYAVRGQLPMTAEKLQQEINQGSTSRPFDEVLFCNIGNPHSVGQKPISFYRKVLALCDCPVLLENPMVGNLFESDAIARAKELLCGIKGGTGAYSHSMGVPHIRQNVVEFLEKRDGHKANVDDIFLTNGASAAIQMILQVLISGPEDAVLIPIPQYPIYSALIALLNGQQMGYQMNEDKGWTVDIDEVKAQIDAARQKGVCPKALVIINPGNPIGNCFSYDNLKDIVKMCKEEGIILLSDEVYQENIYTDKPFFSVKQVVRDLGPSYDEFEFVSFHSTSKGFIGECGRRGGYMEVCGFDKDVRAELLKLASSGLCANLDGQIMVDLMVKGPENNGESYALFKQERETLMDSLKRKSQMLYSTLNSIEGVTCQELQGAMYAFPRIHMSEGALAAAEAAQQTPDTYYALSLLEHTGICGVPGSGFGQAKGTWHLRMTFLPEEGKLREALSRFKEHHEMFARKHAAAQQKSVGV